MAAKGKAGVFQQLCTLHRALVHQRVGKLDPEPRQASGRGSSITSLSSARQTAIAGRGQRP